MRQVASSCTRREAQKRMQCTWRLRGSWPNLESSPCLILSNWRKQQSDRSSRMYKIGRIYAGNFGYRDAWFDGVSLDLRSPFSGEPAHTILKAPNGTGKTSLLGFVFSCFEPQIKRFLPHLNDQSRAFHHYFDAHGLPAIALVEFLLPRHTGQEGKRLGIG